MTGDRWRTAYDSSSLNRAGQTGISRPQYHLPELRGRQIVLATLPELLAIEGFRNIHGIIRPRSPAWPGKNKNPASWLESNGVLSDLRPFPSQIEV